MCERIETLGKALEYSILFGRMGLDLDHWSFFWFHFKNSKNSAIQGKMNKSSAVGVILEPIENSAMRRSAMQSLTVLLNEIMSCPYVKVLFTEIKNCKHFIFH